MFRAQTNCCRLLVGLACVVGLPFANAAPLTVSNSQPLTFGKFVAANGSITVSPNGNRVASGAIVLLQSGPGQAAQFLVTGDANATYAVTLPADGTVSISNGLATMPVNAFVSSPLSSGLLSGAGTQVLKVGARLDVTIGLPPAVYSGTFSVVIDYN